MHAGVLTSHKDITAASFSLHRLPLAYIQHKTEVNSDPDPDPDWLCLHGGKLDSNPDSDHLSHVQGRSQKGVQGVQLNPPSKLMTIVYALIKLMAEIF